MSNEIAVFGRALPAHLQDQTQGVSDYWDDVGSSGVARIKMKGNVLQAVVGGEVIASSAPLQPMNVVLLRPSKVGRTYYEGVYVEGSKELPTCYSNDGETPAPDAQKPQCTRCDLCPMNMKGSGTQPDTKACRYRQSIAVWTPGENDNTWDTIFQVNLSATAIFDDKPNQQGYMGLQALLRFYRTNKLDPSKAWTQLCIDPFSEQKRILMKPLGYIEDPQEYEQVRHLIESDEIERILRLGVLDGEGEQPAPAGFENKPAHLQTQPVHAPVSNSVKVTNDNITVCPFTGEILFEDEPIVDEVPTYWREDETGKVVVLQAGTNLPVEAPGITEVTVDDYNAYEHFLAEERARKEEEARRLEAERKAKEAALAAQQAAEAAAAAAAPRTRTRGAPASTAETTATAAPATTTGRTRGATRSAAPATETVEAPAGGRRRNAAATANASTPAAEATTGTRSRTRGVAAAQQETAAAPAAETSAPAARTRSSRRASVNNTAADASPALRAAQQAAAEAPADEQPQAVGGEAELPDAVQAALDAALLNNNE